MQNDKRKVIVYFVRRWGIVLLLAVTLYCCKNESGTPGKVVIVSTNDMHAQLARFPLLATLIQQKKTEGGEVIVVDAGDRFSGNPYVDHALERGEPMIRLMNKVGYDVVTMGNHDFDYGQKILKKRLHEANFPVVCANMLSEKSELGQLPAYQMIERGGLKFCFFSLIQTGANHLPATNPANLEDISFRYFKDVVPEYKRVAEECDVMIGLTHLGFANDSLLALVMPELEVIVGGHSHTVIREPKKVNGVLIGQAGSNLEYAGVTTLRFKGKKLVDKSYQLVSLKDIGTPDQEIALLVEEISNRPEFKKIMGQAAEDLTRKEDVASLMTDAMRDAVGGDFAFYNKGGVRLNELRKGEITMEKIYKMEPFSNYIVVHEWNLNKMEDFILKDYNRGKDPGKRYINYYISGGKYEIIRNLQGEGIEVKFYDARGKWFKDKQKKYKIAFSNYVASSNELVKGGEVTDIFITDAIAVYLQKQGTVKYTEQRAFVK